MSEVYTIKSVSGPKEWHGQHGPMLSYKLDLDNNGVLERQVEMNRKPESRAPEVGELIAGDLQEGNYGPKFKLDYEATKELPRQTSLGGSSEARAGSRGSWQPESERDPERAARILRQHSQEMALRLLAVNTSPPDVYAPSDVFELADLFDQDVLQTGQQASEGQKTEEALPETPAQGSSSPSSPPEPTSEELKDIEMALDCIWVGANADARRAVAAYMLTQLDEKDLLRACNQLTNAQDPNSQETTLTAMKQRTVKWQGGPLPKDNDPLEDVPF